MIHISSGSETERLACEVLMFSCFCGSFSPQKPRETPDTNVQDVVPTQNTGDLAYH